MQKRTRKKLLDFIKSLNNVRSLVIRYGFEFFGGLGFLYSVFALAFIFSEKGIKLPPIFYYSLRAFGSWIAVVVLMFFVGLILLAVCYNKKNWGKEQSAPYHKI